MGLSGTTKAAASQDKNKILEEKLRDLESRVNSNRSGVNKNIEGVKKVTALATGAMESALGAESISEKILSDAKSVFQKILEELKEEFTQKREELGALLNSKVSVLKEELLKEGKDLQSKLDSLDKHLDEVDSKLREGLGWTEEESKKIGGYVLSTIQIFKESGCVART